MRRTVLVLSLLFVSMGAGVWLLNLIEQRTSVGPRQMEASHRLVAAAPTTVSHSIR